MYYLNDTLLTVSNRLENSVMVDFKDFRPDDLSPIYKQILLYIKKGAVSGTIKDGDELPSRRTLSVLLGINPNTVQKAFALLEEEGLIESRSGAKSLMCLKSARLDQLKAELTDETARDLTQSLKQLGLSKKDALKLIDSYWDKENE